MARVNPMKANVRQIWFQLNWKGLPNALSCESPLTSSEIVVSKFAKEKMQKKMVRKRKPIDGMESESRSPPQSIIRRWEVGSARMVLDSGK